MKCISYSLFGYNKERPESCFDFHSYLRGLMICIRMNRLLYPDWHTVIHMDPETFTAYGKLFYDAENGQRFNDVSVTVCDPAPLTLAMLWRLKPIFEMKDGKWKYTHVICRDTDSPAIYKEAQAVQQWINNDKAMHAITDSDSHSLPLLGGMIGMRPDYFTERTGWISWEEMVNRGRDVDFSMKGADQTFLNTYVYPYFAQHGKDSITQHYFFGMPNTFLSDYHTCLCPRPGGHKPDCRYNITLGISADLKESDHNCGHIGSAGWYTTTTGKFLFKYKHLFEDLLKAEGQFPEVFGWVKDGFVG